MNETQAIERPSKPIITSYQKDEIVHKLALEQPQRAIAKEYKITQPAVSDINRANKDKIEEVKQLLISENLDDIRKSIRDDISNNKILSEEFKITSNITSSKVAYKTSIQRNIISPLLQKLDIFPTNTIHIGDNTQHNYVIPPVIQSWIDAQSCNTYDQDGNLVDNTQAVDTQGDAIDNDK